MKIAIVHDFLNQRGGAERVVSVLHGIFPDAPIYTSILDRSNLFPELKDADIRPSWMQKLPGMKRHFKKYLLLYPHAIESFDLREYDLVISSSSWFAKGAIKGDRGVHICYCLTPMRLVWDYENYIKRENFNFLYRSSLPIMKSRLRRWDQNTKHRPDHYIAISTTVRARIRRIYGVNSEIIFPPVEVGKYVPNAHPDGYYLVVSRLNAYKCIDVAVEAFNSLGLPLKIIGSGPYEDTLKGMARPNVEFLGMLPDREVADYYAGCKALIFPGEEDFGIVPLEANAAGRPVIAYRGGGALDTVTEGYNGMFFDEKTTPSLIEAVRTLESGKYSFDPEKIRKHALLFDKPVFIENMKAYLERRVGRHLFPKREEPVMEVWQDRLPFVPGRYREPSLYRETRV
jgi:glycosyltransferase involved in cell wall biosynthesis